MNLLIKNYLGYFILIEKIPRLLILNHVYTLLILK